MKPVVSLDTTFLVDLRKRDPAAVARATVLEQSGEPKCVTAPVAAELLVGAHRFGDAQLERTRRLLGSLILLETDMESCEEAGRIGADLISRGTTISGMDLFIAAISKRHGQRLLTRDRSFAKVRGLSVEFY